MLRAYLNGLFKKNDGAYLVTADTFTGSVILSLAKPCSRPASQADHPSSGVVTVRLPTSHYTNDCRGKFLYLTPTDEAKINLVLQKEFDNNFIAFCIELKTLGMQTQDAVDQFMYANKMDDFFGGDIETLRKKLYRHQIATMKKTREKLRQKANYVFKKAIKNIPHSAIY